MIPETYAAWRRCITVDCGVALTRDYLKERVRTLGDATAPETRKFRARYGDAHLQRVLRWFERAQREVG